MTSETGTVDSFTIAVPTGRPLLPTLDFLDRTGLPTTHLRNMKTRELVVEEWNAGVRFLLCKPSAVPVFVELGAADIGIVGSDVLEEVQSDVVQIADLGYMPCRLVLAAPGDSFDGLLNKPSPLRIATKFKNLTRQYVSQFNVELEIVYLPGSVEAATRLNFADAIVDVVETGRTLRDNQLVELATISHCSARLIANRLAAEQQSPRLTSLLRQFHRAVATESGARADGVRF